MNICLIAASTTTRRRNSTGDGDDGNSHNRHGGIRHHLQKQQQAEKPEKVKQDEQILVNGKYFHFHFFNFFQDFLRVEQMFDAATKL